MPELSRYLEESKMNQVEILNSYQSLSVKSFPCLVIWPLDVAALQSKLHGRAETPIPVSSCLGSDERESVHFKFGGS